MDQLDASADTPAPATPWYRKALLALGATLVFVGGLEWGFRSLLPLPGDDLYARTFF